MADAIELRFGPKADAILAHEKVVTDNDALIDAGHIRPAVDRVYPFAETNAAMAHVESSRAKGKVVIRVR